MTLNTQRRRLLGMAGLMTGASLLPKAVMAAADSATSAPIPILFVHGNGDCAAVWQTTIWRFESNGWPAARLHALNFPYPLARDDDGVAQPGHSSAAESAAFLAAEVERMLARTGAKQLALMGSSRGGNAIRNYLQGPNAAPGAADKISHVVLGGTPNHGVYALPGFREGGEFSGTGPFLTALNKPHGKLAAAGDEVVGPTRWLTLRSDHNDKYAQPVLPGPDGKPFPTNVGYDGPALKGAVNLVLPGADHREAAFSPAAFAAAFRFITGQAPQTIDIVAQAKPLLGGVICGQGADSTDAASGDYPNNIGMAGARVEIYAVDADGGSRLGAARYAANTGSGGQWGPFEAQAEVRYEFVVSAPGYATAHFYRSPLPRSSDVLHMTARRLTAADRAAGAVVVLERPRGYFDLARDRVEFDGAAPPGLPPAGAVLAESRLALAAEARAIKASFNGERLVGRTWPAAEGHVTVLEITQ